MWLFILGFIVVPVKVAPDVSSEMDEAGVYKCGKNLSSKIGYFHTPNFPAMFPLPLKCRWVLPHAPDGQKVNLYFNQNFFKGPITLTRINLNNKTGKYEPTSTTYAYLWKAETWTHPAEYVIIQVDIQTERDMHVRVQDHFLNVHGFNFSYEIVPLDTTRRQKCSAPYCSYLGNCYVSADYSSHQCHCIRGYYGPRCQYGPLCDPRRNITTCSHNAPCEYHLGSRSATCQCPPEYTGTNCELQASQQLTRVHTNGTICKIEKRRERWPKEGEFLVLYCRASPSPDMRVYWLKDGQRIVPHNTNREIEMGRVSDMDIYFLRIWEILSLDAGRFACICNSSRGTASDSVVAHVLSEPRVLLTSYSASVLTGARVNVSCLATNDEDQVYKYTWYRGKTRVDIGMAQEKAEMLIPWGIRLVVYPAKESAIYTCHVEHPAVKAGSRSFRLTVVPAKTSDGCAAELSNRIDWNFMLPGQEDVRMCPRTNEGEWTW